MWKNKRTLFTSIATILTLLLFLCRFASIIGPDGDILNIMYYEKTSYVVMLIMLLAAGICAVFCYKVPLLQSRVCMLTALMELGFQIWLVSDFLRFRNEMVFSASMLFPTLSMALNIIAARCALTDGIAQQAAMAILKKRSKKNNGQI